MIRVTILAPAAMALSLIFVAACDKAADDQNKANSAQGEANKKIAEANKEAAEKTNSAQAEADKKIAAATADFSKRREDYRHKMSNDLVDLDKKIATLEANAKTATGKTKTDLDANLAAIRTRRTAFTTEMKGLETATADKFDGMKTSLDKSWSDLKALVDKA